MNAPQLPWVANELRRLRQDGLLRSLRTLEPVSGSRIRLQSGSECFNLASNDYLALAGSKRLRRAALDAIEQMGWGAAASQFVSGFTPLHARLCRHLAALEEAEDAVLFSSGYHANLGAITTLAGPGDRVVVDKLSHASIVDGARLSRAQVRVFPHRNLDKLARLLATRRATGAGGRTLVVTDSVFSMDGDLAPLEAIVDLCERHGAMLLVDEAHATGVLGAHGTGGMEERGVKGRATLIVGTLSKALGGIGGFVAGSRELCDLVRNRARPAIYSTSLPPAAAAAALAALAYVREESGRRARVRVRARARKLRTLLREQGVRTPEGSAAIVPVIVGTAGRALAVSERLQEREVFCPAIRPPTVARGTSRLRLSLTAAFTPEDVERIARAVGRVLRETP